MTRIRPATAALPLILALASAAAVQHAGAESAAAPSTAVTPAAAPPAITPTPARSAGPNPGATPPETGSEAPRARVEARSSDLLAVGTVLGDRMAIHLTRIVDNSPVRNAVVAVLLRGTTHPAVAEADGSYSFRTSDLALPGPAAIELLVTLGDTHEELHGTLELAGEPGHSADKSSSRQLGWWVLNFAVCIGFLWLWSRRKSANA